jgi:hypothetical protein
LIFAFEFFYFCDCSVVLRVTIVRFDWFDFCVLGLSQRKIIDFFRIQKCKKDDVKMKCRSLQGEFFIYPSNC